MGILKIFKPQPKKKAENEIQTPDKNLFIVEDEVEEIKLSKIVLNKLNN